MYGIYINKFLKNIDEKDSVEIWNFILKYQQSLSEDNINTLVQRVIALNDARLIYSVSLEIKNLSIKNKNDLTNALLLIKNPKYIYLYACDVDYLSKNDIKALLNVIIEINNVKYIYLFARDVKGLDNKEISLLLDAVIKSNDKEYIISFACNVENLTRQNIDKLTKAIVNTKEPKEIYSFAYNVYGLTKQNINQLTKAIILTKNERYIYLFSRDIENLSNKNKMELLKALLPIAKTCTIINFFDCCVSDELIKSKELEEIVISSKKIIIIAIYLFKTKNEILINKIFENRANFILYCILNKKIMKISDEDIEQFASNTKFNYVDDNIQDYFDNRKVINKKSHI